MKFVPKKQLDAYLGGSLRYAGTVSSGPAAQRDALDCYRHLLARGHPHLPYFLVADVLEIISRGYETEFRHDSGPTGGMGDEEDGDLRALRSRYERECLGRLLQAPDIVTATEIVETTPDPGLRRRILELLFRSLGPCFPSVWAVNPSQLRDLDFTPPDPAEASRLESAFLEACPGDCSLAEALAQFLADMNEGIRWGNLLKDEDFFELTHFRNLPTDYLRIGSRQLVMLRRQLESGGVLRESLKPNEDEVDTAFLDETHYPTGGITGLTNRGSFENLVMSELAYMSEGAGAVSLFELRFVENELLFYLRDSGSLRRRRRTIHFIFDLGELVNTKAIGYEYQYLVLLQGLAMRLVDDLFALFEFDSLRFIFHYLCDEGQKEYVQSEVGILRTVLADYVSHGWVQFRIEESVALADLPDPKRKSYALVFSTPPEFTAWKAEAQAVTDEEVPLLVSLSEIGGSSKEPLDLPRRGLDLDQIRIRKDALLRDLVS